MDFAPFGRKLLASDASPIEGWLGISIIRDPQMRNVRGRVESEEPSFRSPEDAASARGRRRPDSSGPIGKAVERSARRFGQVRDRIK